jgi:hypothetical protein
MSELKLPLYNFVGYTLNLQQLKNVGPACYNPSIRKFTVEVDGKDISLTDYVSSTERYDMSKVAEKIRNDLIDAWSTVLSDHKADQV